MKLQTLEKKTFVIAIFLHFMALWKKNPIGIGALFACFESVPNSISINRISKLSFTVSD